VIFQRVKPLVRLLRGRFHGNKPFHKLRVGLALFPLFSLNIINAAFDIADFG